MGNASCFLRLLTSAATSESSSFNAPFGCQKIFPCQTTIRLQTFSKRWITARRKRGGGDAAT